MRTASLSRTAPAEQGPGGYGAGYFPSDQSFSSSWYDLGTSAW